MPKAQTNAKRLVRLREGALYLSLSPWALRRIIQAGQIPVVKVGDNTPWLVDLEDLNQWVDQHKVRIE
jgi:hypothetical protein